MIDPETSLCGRRSLQAIEAGNDAYDSVRVHTECLYTPSNIDRDRVRLHMPAICRIGELAGASIVYLSSWRTEDEPQRYGVVGLSGTTPSYEEDGRVYRPKIELGYAHIVAGGHATSLSVGINTRGLVADMLARPSVDALNEHTWARHVNFAIRNVLPEAFDHLKFLERRRVRKEIRQTQFISGTPVFDRKS